jgi:hypothetical protein
MLDFRRNVFEAFSDEMIVDRWIGDVSDADGTDRSPDMGDAPELRRIAAERCTVEGVIEAIRSGYLTGPFERQGLCPINAWSAYDFFLRPSPQFWSTWEEGGFGSWRALATNVTGIEFGG